MMKSVTLNGTKIKIWATSADARAWVEVENASKLPFIHPEGIAYMPDMHAGASVSIGAVMPLLGVVVPIAIGSDCGCGMRAVKTNIKASTLTPEVIRKDFMRGTRKVVVVGDEPQKTLKDEELLPQGWDPAALPMITKGNGWNKLVRKQLGTLGAGNHFIEFQKDDDDNLWLMIHSGSRGVGS
jgi:tRNA-splicing ligase RtcB